jgi:hypothetical protein
MAVKNENLHGNVPENSTIALLLIDVINDAQTRCRSAKIASPKGVGCNLWMKR